MSTESTNTKSFYDRDEYIVKWSKMLCTKGDAFHVAAALVNKHKNFQSAAAVLFGLSFRTHKEWLIKCSNYWEAEWNKFPAGSQCNADWCIAFQQHYVNEVDKYPADA